MSFSLAVEDGDLRLNGSTLGRVWGPDKLGQDMSLWLRERYQSDRFHRNYGSILDDFIGGVIESDTRYEVQSEVLRVLRNYQALQYRRIKERPEYISSDEILLEILDVRVSTDYDRVDVRLRVQTGDRRERVLDITTTV